MLLKLGRFQLDLSHPRVMGVLNVTPDSFSDGGDFLQREDALRQAANMLADGVDIIDIGGESTRPGAREVPVNEEMDRVVPIIEALVGEADIPISVDTSKPKVMQAAVAAGASLVNDVYALRRNGALKTAKELPVAICLMHMLGSPRTMQQKPKYDRLPADIIDFLADRVAECEDAGIERERLIVDPGFGFGKTDEHNLILLQHLDELAALGLPILVGLSRKRTLGNITSRAPKDRQAAGLAAAVLAVERGAHIVRTHDVAATVDALKVFAALPDWQPNHAQSDT